MPDDPLAQVLRLVAEGRLTAEEAAPILDGLDRAGSAAAAGTDAPSGAGAAPDAVGRGMTPPPAGPGVMRPGEPRFARVEVRDGGRTSVNLRVPLSLGRQALGLVPGLSLRQMSEITEAVSRGLTGPIVDIQDDAGDGVRIVLE
jgi:hypothetical protein